MAFEHWRFRSNALAHSDGTRVISQHHFEWVILRLRALGGTSVVLINLPITLISNAFAALTFGVPLLNLVGVPGLPGFGLYYTAQLMGLTVVFVLFADVVVGAAGESS